MSISHMPVASLRAESSRRGRGLPAKLAGARRPATVRRILSAAENVFAERGLAGARIDAIARAARVNKALLYYYFRSKEELHRATLDMLFRQLRADTARQKSASPRDQLIG